MEACQPTARAALQCAFNAARATMLAAFRASTSWRWWQQYCSNCGTDPWLRNTSPTIRSQLHLGFAARTCTGLFGKERQVDAQTEKSLLASCGTSLCEAATAHLIVMVFYFLLRDGKYTLPPEHRTTCTVQFRICDISFWQGQFMLLPTSNAAILAAALSVTLIMDSQKNGQRGDVIHQEAVNGNFCPDSRSLLCAIVVQGMSSTTPISFVHPGIHVQPSHILHAFRCGAKLEYSTRYLEKEIGII